MKQSLQEELEIEICKLLDNRQWRLVVMPTEQCNFRCTYCYEKFEQGLIKPELVRGIKTLIENRAEELSVLDLDWFGGEPLLAYPIIVDISEHIKRLGNKHSFVFRSAVTTNGYLLDQELLHTLVNAGVKRYQISLDGFGKDHDSTRKLTTGMGTFERIWSNLKKAALTNLDFFITLRIHSSPDNKKHLPRLIDEIKKQFGGDKRFGVFFKGIAKLWGPNDDRLKVFSSCEQSEVQSNLITQLQNKLPSTIVDRKKVNVCYASRPNCLVIRSDGSLAKCTVALSDFRNRIGTLEPNGDLLIDDNKLSPWFEGLARGNPLALACPYAFMEQKEELQRV